MSGTTPKLQRPATYEDRGAPSSCRRRKLPIYGRQGVRGAWFIDPVARVLHRLELRGEKLEPAALYTGDARARIEPFAEIELDLLFLWGEARASTEPASAEATEEGRE